MWHSFHACTTNKHYSRIHFYDVDVRYAAIADLAQRVSFISEQICALLRELSEETAGRLSLHRSINRKALIAH
jgi:hypothetical protein